MDVRRVRAEKQRLANLLERAELPKQKRDMLEPLIDNLAWQKCKLDDARKKMQNEDIVCEYDNGGGQKGTRENPYFKAYTNLFRSYMVGLEKYTSYVPEELKEEATATISILDQVRQIKKANA